jgi:hypothetical protein
MPPITVYVAVTTPTTTLGTITLLSADGGTSFFNFPSGGLDGLGTPSYVNDYYHAALNNTGYVTVQAAWAEDCWDNTNEPDVKSITDEACRPATLLQYISAHYAASSKPVCAQGQSGGAAAIGYSMAWYGADRNSGGSLDTVMLTSGPALSDIQSGCAYTSPINSPPPQTVCGSGKCVGGASTPSWQDCLEYPNKLTDCFSPPNPYPHSTLYAAAQSVSRHTIGPHNPYIAENNCNNYQNNGQTTTDLNAEWASMNLIAPGANFNYPHTFAFGYLCSGPVLDPLNNNTSNNSAAQGWSYQSLLAVSSSQNGGFPVIYRVDRCSGPEMIWGPNAIAVGTGGNDGYDQSKGDMITNCRSPH